MHLYFKIQKGVTGSIFEPHPCAQGKKCLLDEYLQMVLVPFFAVSTAFESTKKFGPSFPGSPVFFELTQNTVDFTEFDNFMFL